MSTTLGALRRHPLASLMAAAAVLALAGCGRSGPDAAKPAETPASAAGAHAEEGEGGHEEKGALELSEQELQQAGIRVEPVSAAAAGGTLTVTATILPDADRLARIAPRTSGRIVSAPVAAGQRVAAGQVLATLDSVEVGEAQSAWQQAQATLRIAEDDLKRAQELVAEQILARKELLRAQSARDHAAAAARAASDKLRLLGSRPGVDEASRFVLTAPFGGTVIDKRATTGDVGAADDALFTVADLSRVWILADLPEAALAKVRVGSAASVTVSAYPGETFKGRVDYLAATVDKDRRTIGARIVVPNAQGRLKPEMFATALLDTGGPDAGPPTISLPDDAIVMLQGQPTAFVRDADGFEPRPVEPGERNGGRTVVKAGLKAGEQVVTAGAFALKARMLKSQLGHGH